MVARVKWLQIYTSYDGTNYQFQNGIFSRAPFALNFAAFMLWFPPLHFSYISITVQFIYRYLILCK